jgi:hypothetical protein
MPTLKSHATSKAAAKTVHQQLIFANLLAQGPKRPFDIATSRRSVRHADACHGTSGRPSA